MQYTQPPHAQTPPPQVTVADVYANEARQRQEFHEGTVDLMQKLHAISGEEIHIDPRKAQYSSLDPAAQAAISSPVHGMYDSHSGYPPHGQGYGQPHQRHYRQPANQPPVMHAPPPPPPYPLPEGGDAGHPYYANNQMPPNPNYHYGEPHMDLNQIAQMENGMAPTPLNRGYPQPHYNHAPAPQPHMHGDPMMAESHMPGISVERYGIRIKKMKRRMFHDIVDNSNGRMLHSDLILYESAAAVAKQYAIGGDSDKVKKILTLDTAYGDKLRRYAELKSTMNEALKTRAERAKHSVEMQKRKDDIFEVRDMIRTLL